ncbi:MAG: hypothetical protein ABIJ59_13385 [Pseudomonadota bacterium]
MKPISINLAVKSNFWRKISLPIAAIFAIITLGITVMNMNDYYANIEVIKTYELRIKEVNKRSEVKRKAAQKNVIDSKEDKRFKQDLNYLSDIIKKNMFALPAVLTEIERVKSDRVDINELIFSDDFMVVRIKGESNHVKSVSEFVVGMDRSNHFDIDLSKEEISDDKKIIFELKARWKRLENDQKI